MPNLSIDTARSGETWAEVRAHNRVMPYRRTGAGRAILLLNFPEEGKPPWPQLVAALGERFRLILPQPPDDEIHVAEWLADFLEGLGLSNVAIVAADRFCIPTLELTLLGVHQVCRLVLMPNGQGGETGLGGALEAATGGAVVPLLVVRSAQPVQEVLPLVMRFLAA